jgi:hypothetical protein
MKNSMKKKFHEKIMKKLMKFHENLTDFFHEKSFVKFHEIFHEISGLQNEMIFVRDRALSNT